MIRLTSPSQVADARLRLDALLGAHAAWFCAESGDGPRVCLRRGDWEVRAEHGALFVVLCGARGLRTWRVAGWEQSGGKLLIHATRRAGAERTVLEFVPRATAAEAARALTEARLARCASLAALVREATPGARVEQSRLSRGARRGEPGRYARILLRAGRTSVAATGPVVRPAPEDADAFLASSLLWFERLQARRGGAPKALRLIAGRELARATAERVALLRESARERLELFASDDELRALEPVGVPSLERLLEEAPRPFNASAGTASETARRILDLDPEAVDFVRARHGETLRYRGLAFARVRRVMGAERAWFFGVEGSSRGRVLDETTWPDFLKLFGELEAHRRADAADRAHALFRAAPEAWLESLLRRDITRLDPGLRVSPLHAQLRAPRTRPAAARPIDLLALRRDGRLAVVELKVTPDAALPIQAADYWRRITAHHRAGHFARARLFGDAEISDSPPLVYLVAPLLRFHRAFETLTRGIRPEVEMYRYDLNEDWRAGVRVARRVTLTNNWQ